MSPRPANLWTWMAGLAGLALAGWLWYWFTANFERRTERVDVGWSAAAKRNPYLAAEHFLQRLGIDTVSSSGRGLLRSLPAATDTVVVRGLGPMRAARRQAIRQWITSGGRLVVEAMIPIGRPDQLPAGTLLADAGAVLRETPAEGDDEAGAEEVLAVLHPSATGLADAIEVGFLERYHLDDLHGAADDIIEAGGRPRLLEYRMGDGSLVVLSDTVFMTNGDIDNHDHALFTALLAGAGRGRVWLLYDGSAPALPVLLWQLAPQAMIAAGVLLALLLWHPGGRLGPLLPPAPRARRDLLLHLDAAAGLLWRHGRGGLQLAATRERIERAWLRRHPSLRALPRAQRAGWLAERTGLDAEAIDRALYRRPDREAPDAALIETTRTLRQLWLKERPVRPAWKRAGG